MKAGDMVTINESAHDVRSVWFRNTRNNSTPMLVLKVNVDHAVHSAYWRIALIHPEEGVVYITSDHLQVIS